VRWRQSLNVGLDQWFRLSNNIRHGLTPLFKELIDLYLNTFVLQLGTRASQKSCSRLTFYHTLFVYSLDMNSCLLPLWFRPGNRYEVTVYGRQHTGSRAEVVCAKSIEFRTGESLYSFHLFTCVLCLLVLKIKLSQELSWYIFLTLPHVLIKKSLMFTWVHTRRTTGPNSWLPQTVPEFVCSLLNSDYYSYIFNLICNTATGRLSLFFRCMGVIVILINRWYSVINLI